MTSFISKNIIFIIIFLLVVRIISFQHSIKEGEYIKVAGTVSTEPSYSGKNQIVSINNWRIFLPLYPKVEYGDYIAVSGIVTDGQIKDGKLETKREGGFVAKLRKKIINFYNYNLPEPHASLVSGMSIGSKQGMPYSFWQSLQTTGTAHVVVASGTNVSLVAGFVLYLALGVMRRGRALLLALIFIWLYVCFSGFSAPLVRAGAMASVAFLAQWMGRLAQAMRSLAIVAIALLFVKPWWISDLSFQLSFLATYSLILFQSQVDRRIQFLPSVLRSGLSTSLAAQVGVAPLLFFTFGKFNPFSPFINSLILWTTPFITIIGIVSGILSLFVPLLARLILLTSYPFTLFFVWIIQIFS